MLSAVVDAVDSVAAAAVVDDAVDVNIWYR